jgi:putative endonuclease
VSEARSALGVRGEEAAAKELIRAGYSIVACRVRTKFGEIDIIARDGDTMCFVEVKTRTDTRATPPAESVHAAKQGHIVRAALSYCKEHALQGKRLRFDVVTVAADEEALVCRIIKDAFMPDARYSW